MENNIQYFHIRNEHEYSDVILPKGGTTIAVKVPTLEQMQLMVLCESFPIELGIAKCHEDDLYNKKIGRNVSAGRISTIECRVIKSSDTSSGVYVTLQAGRCTIFLEGRSSGSVQLVFASEKK
jgi:hypothetical protein